MTFLALCFVLYFAPAMVASGRQHPSATAIWLCNFFFGWTGVGWLACLIWATTGPRQMLVYPMVAYVPPSSVPGQPPAWTPRNGAPETLCGACYRPLLPSSSYCSLCGAATQRVA